MDCWIDVSNETDRTVVRLAGRLNVAQVFDLLQVCGSTGARRLFIDLSDLLNADGIGIETLRRLRREGATLTGVSGYIKLKLDTASEPRHSPL